MGLLYSFRRRHHLWLFRVFRVPRWELGVNVRHPRNGTRDPKERKNRGLLTGNLGIRGSVFCFPLVGTPTPTVVSRI